MSTKPQEKEVVTLLALDPGTNNFAYAVLHVEVPTNPEALFVTRTPVLKSGKQGKPKTERVPYSGFRGNVVCRGLIHDTLRSLTSSKDGEREFGAFREAVVDLLTRHQPDFIIAERYMLRAGSGGTAIESINQMLGVLRTLGVPIRMIPASQWKNMASKVGHFLESDHKAKPSPVVGVYERLGAVDKAHIRDPSRITVHEVDAAHIGAYGANLLNSAPVDDFRFRVALKVQQSPFYHYGEPASASSRSKRVKRKGKR